MEKETIVYCGRVTEEIPDADICVTGSWTDKGNASADIIEYIRKIEGKKIAYFGTAGYGGSVEYYEKLFDRIKENIDASNEILGVYYCQGKMPMQVRERYVQMLTQNPDDAGIKVSVKNFDDALSHPDEDDIRKAKEWVRIQILNG